MGKVIPIKSENSGKFQDDLHLAMQGQIFNSLDEANAFLKEFYERRNSSGIKEFLGLSPVQMQKILYQPLEIGKFVQINTLEPSAFESCQTVQHAYFLLTKIHEAKELRLTEKGNLPRVLVKDFWFTFYKNDKYYFEPHREEDCPELTRIKCLLEYSGLIRKQSKKVRLSKKGDQFLTKKDSKGLYELLFESYFNEWNWSYMDRYSENQIIQQAGQFSLMLISELAQEWITVEELGMAFIRAFPMSLEQIDAFWGTPQESLISCLSNRFLKRTCQPLGLIEWQNKESLITKSSDCFRIAEFFKNGFVFDKSV